ncbi:MAG: helix-turn-helix transcriptional regulator, partial [Solirubrobacterales bacterium]|nr:helix-turn-helix transcriptional regulator [Solirubrobacterales bacterium]
MHEEYRVARWVATCHDRAAMFDASQARAHTRRLRSDAAANRERILVAATAVVRRQGEKVPMATIADEAGVGIGTVYRHYPTRSALLTALTERSFRLVLDHARAAARSKEPAPVALAQFLEQTIASRDAFILPL